MKETKTVGESLTESNNINKSLLTLGKVLLVVEAIFIPKTLLESWQKSQSNFLQNAGLSSLEKSRYKVKFLKY